MTNAIAGFRDISEGAIDSLTNFSAMIYPQLVTTRENLCFSPLSIFAVLNMLGAGAAGRTRHEIAEALNLPRESLGQLAVPGQIVGNVARLANAVFVQAGLDVEDKYYEFLKNCRTPIDGVDFRDTEKTVDIINQWASRNTNGLIDNIVAVDDVEQAVMVLANAVYFKDRWKHQFDPKLTANGKFWLDDKHMVLAPIMRQTERYYYAEDEWCQILEMPYDSEFAMTVVLPYVHMGDLSAFEKRLNFSAIDEWRDIIKPAKVTVSMPKFGLVTDAFLISALENLNVRIFDEGADFSGITREKPFFVSEMLHRAKIDVDEEGIEAAATTVVACSGYSGVELEPKVFTIDHPFLYMIKHQPTGTILFMGRVVNPRHT